MSAGFADQERDRLEVPELVEGVVEACGAIKETALRDIREEEVEPRVPPLGEVAVLEALPPREQRPSLGRPAQCRVAPGLPMRISSKKLVVLRQRPSGCNLGIAGAVD